MVDRKVLTEKLFDLRTQSYFRQLASTYSYGSISTIPAFDEFVSKLEEDDDMDCYPVTRYATNNDFVKALKEVNADTNICMSVCDMDQFFRGAEEVFFSDTNIEYVSLILTQYDSALKYVIHNALYIKDYKFLIVFHQMLKVRAKVKMCEACGKNSPDMKSCSVCSWSYYCDKGCQVKDWPQHKLKCSKLGTYKNYQTYLSEHIKGCVGMLSLRHLNVEAALITVYSTEKFAKGMEQYELDPDFLVYMVKEKVCDIRKYENKEVWVKDIVTITKKIGLDASTLMSNSAYKIPGITLFYIFCKDTGIILMGGT
jgi:hypothetical protein